MSTIEGGPDIGDGAGVGPGVGTAGKGADPRAGPVAGIGAGTFAGVGARNRAVEKIEKETAEKRRRGIIRAAFTRRQGFVVGSGLMAGLIGSYISLGFSGPTSSVAGAAFISLSIVILLGNGPGLQALTPTNRKSTTRPISRGFLWLWCFVAITLAQMGWLVLGQLQPSLDSPTSSLLIESSTTQTSSSATTSTKVH